MTVFTISDLASVKECHLQNQARKHYYIGALCHF